MGRDYEDLTTGEKRELFAQQVYDLRVSQEAASSVVFDRDELEPRRAMAPAARTSEPTQAVAPGSPEVPRHFKETVAPKAKSEYTVGDLARDQSRSASGSSYQSIYEREEACVQKELAVKRGFTGEVYMTSIVDGQLKHERIDTGVSKPSIGLAGDAATRKASPIASGLLFYFPNACAAVANLSKIGNDQHNPGQPLHWAFDKSTDEADCILRHLAQTGDAVTHDPKTGKSCEPGYDTDGVRHAAKVAWRALALLERELLSAHPELQPGKNVRNFKR